MKKRGCFSVGESERSFWEELNPELMALITARMPADEMLRSVPFVCRSWRDAAGEPDCWGVVDVQEWCRRCNRTDVIDYAVRKLARRSQGTMRRLNSFKLGDSGFSFVAGSCGGCLQTLQMPMSSVLDLMVETHAQMLKMLKVLDISYCSKITCKGLEAFGRNCKLLIDLRRNMPPPDSEYGEDFLNFKVDEGEAMAVANTMPGLHHLEFGYARFSDHGLEAILAKCGSLRHFDIQGCWNVKMEGDLEEKCEEIEDFRGQWDGEYDDTDSSDVAGEVAPFDDSD